MPYQLEYKRSVDSTWTVFSSTLTAALFPVTIPGLASGTQYDVRCLARDQSGNVSAYSSVSQTTTTSSSTWATVPTISFTQGVAATADISQYDSRGSTDTITHTAGTLPTGVSYDQANKRYAYDGVGAIGGTNGHILTADDAGADTHWASVLTAPGLLSAVRFASQADVTAATFDPTNPFSISHVVFDSSIKPGAAAGSMKFNVLNADGVNNGSAVFWIDPTSHHVYNNGSEFFIFWRQYMPTAFCQTAFPGSGGIDPGKANGFKQILLSQYYNTSGVGQGGSNIPGEIVVENTRQMCAPQLYWQDSGGSDHQVSTIYNGADFRLQNQINNLAISDPSGTLAYPTSAQKYGVMYQNYPKQTGTADPNSFGYHYRANEWQSFLLHVRVGTIGSSNTLIELWCAGDNLAPRLVHKDTAANPGNGNNGNGNIYTGFTLLPYCTARTSNGGFDTAVYYSDIATGTQKIPFPGGFNVTPS